MKIVKSKAFCEVCSGDFIGDFIQHEEPKDDWEWETGEHVPEEWPHMHEQPAPECHVCPNCRAEMPPPVLKKLDEVADEIKAHCRTCKVKKCPPTMEGIVTCEKYKLGAGVN